jgi:exopolysaccharide production protein ExoZ
MSNRGQLSSIQQLRGIAALIVVAFHGTAALALSSNFGVDPTGGLFSGGFAGVDLFFVISGFIIFYLHEGDIDRPQTARAFVVKRVVRIYPMYWLVFFVFGGLMLATHTGKPSYAKSVNELLAAIGLLPQLSSPVIPVAWTLRYEMLFYFSFALAILSVRLFCVLAALVSIVLIFGPDFQLKPFFTNPVILEFILGMLAAWMIPHMSRISSIGSSISGSVLFIALFRASAVSDHFQEGQPTELLYGVAAALIILGWVGLETSPISNSKVSRSRVLGAVGNASYVIYLVHQPLVNLTIKVALRVGIHAPSIPLVAAIIIVPIGVGLGVHRWLEAPLLKLLKVRLLPLRSPPPSSVDNVV